jgi:cell division protein FtsL
MENKEKEDSLNFITIWSKCIDIQMHFNSINLTIKSLAITGFTFFIAGLGYLYKEKVYLEEINVLMWFSLTGALIIVLFYFIDRYWYHLYLKATSVHIAFLEKNNKLDPTLSDALKISEKIGAESKKPIKGIFVVNSEKKTDIFYLILIVPFFIIATYAFFQHDKPNVKEKVIELEGRIKELSNEISKLKSIKADSIKNERAIEVK